MAESVIISLSFFQVCKSKTFTNKFQDSAMGEHNYFTMRMTALPEAQFTNILLYNKSRERPYRPWAMYLLTGLCIFSFSPALYVLYTCYNKYMVFGD